MIERIDLSQSQRLDQFLENHPSAHIMQSSYWGKVKHDWKWHGLLSLTDAGKIRGSMAILEHPLRYLPSCLLYAPCGPIFDDDAAFRELIDAAVDLGREVGAYLLRIDPCIPQTDSAFQILAADCGFSCNKAEDFSLFQPRMNYLLPLNGKTPEALAEGLHPSTRRNIRLAERDGVIIEQGSEDDLPIFMLLMRATAKRCGFTARSEEYFRSLLRGLGEHGGLCLAKIDGVCVAATISAWFGTRYCYLYGCSERSNYDCHANELLQWHMILCALGKGCGIYDFRGVEGSPTQENPHIGLHRFKQGFGAEFVSYIGQLDFKLRPVIAGIMQRVASL